MRLLIFIFLLVGGVCFGQQPTIEKMYHKGRIDVFHHNLASTGFESIVEYGADPEGVEPSDSALMVLLENRAKGILFPPGEYLFTKEFQITYPVQIVGIGFNQGSASILRFPSSGGFHFIDNGAYSSVENIQLRGSHRSTNGITIQAHGVRVEGVYIQGFGSNGIEISSNTYQNANHVTIRDCRLYQNGNDGIRIGGNNSHVITIDHCDAMLNGRWGFNDGSFLGTNMFSNCHAGGNEEGAYRIGHPEARSMLFNCYAEQDQGPNHIEVRATVFRGLMANGYTDKSRGCIDYLCH